MLIKDEMMSTGGWLFKYRGLLPLVILVIGFAMYLRTEIYPETFVLEETPYEVYFEGFAFLVSIIGLLIRIYTVGHTPVNTSGRNEGSQLADSLNTTGIYSIVRNPLYLGNYFMWLGPAIVTGSFWFVMAFTLFYWLYYERIIAAEEAFLLDKFKDKYEKWAVNVPVFIPKFSGFVKPSLPFSIRKVLKKEKNGLLAIFLIFSVFDVVGELIQGTNDFNRFYLIGTAVTLVLYAVLKYLKYNTSVLNEEGR